jgi:hypothetical protein
MTRPLFERRHYKAIAQLLHDVGGATTALGHPWWVAEDFAKMFATDNPNFKRELFMKAVGPPERMTL